MERKVSGYSVSVQWNIASDGTTNYRKDVVYMPDENTEIAESERTLKELTEKELNDIMCELENESKIKDSYPLRNIRNSALK